LGVDFAFAFFLLAGGAAGEVRLVLLALGVGEVGAVVLVDGEAEAALKGAKMVAEDVGVLVEVDGLEGELAQALAPVGVGCAVRGDAATTEFGTRTVLVVHFVCLVLTAWLWCGQGMGLLSSRWWEARVGCLMRNR
jgi:hypothetical protein